jgi:hypothetical protein
LDSVRVFTAIETSAFHFTHGPSVKVIIATSRSVSFLTEALSLSQRVIKATAVFWPIVFDHIGL